MDERTPPTGGSHRRDVLRTVGAAGVGAIAGCLGDAQDADAGANGADTGEPASGDGRDAADGQRLATHPAAAHLDAQPRRGPDPTEATATIIAFEDPSCTRCRTFERKTVPKIESELVEAGTAAYVFRGYPVVYPWGKPATQALESTHARSDAAFWALKDHYYADQPSFREAGPDGVLALTREFLAADTDIDADAVVADAEERAHDAAVQTDLADGERAGATVTPSVFLFRDGQYVTKAQGSVGFDVIKNALGL